MSMRRAVIINYLLVHKTEVKYLILSSTHYIILSSMCAIMLIQNIEHPYIVSLRKHIQTNFSCEARNVFLVRLMQICKAK